MIFDRIEKMSATVNTASNIPEQTKKELLDLLAGLKSEIAKLSETHTEDARSIARFADASTHEATRVEKKPALKDAALKGLVSSVEDFEITHPSLVQIVNRMSVILSNMGL